jgi:hypothetical protein
MMKGTTTMKREPVEYQLDLTKTEFKAIANALRQVEAENENTERGSDTESMILDALCVADFKTYYEDYRDV